MFTVSVLMISQFSAAAELVVGETYSIAEPDLLEEMQQKAATANWQEMFEKDPDSWSGLAPKSSLPLVRENKDRLHTPMYTLDRTISDHTGQVIYPAGYSFNPLAYMTLPSRIVVIGASDKFIPWLEQHAEPLDMVLTAGGNPMKLSEKYGKPIFVLEPKLRDRLNVTAVPSIIHQEGEQLVIAERVLETQKELAHADSQ